MAFKDGIAKVAISLGFIDKLTASGTAKRVAALEKKDPKKLMGWAHGVMNTAPGLGAAVSEHIPTHDMAKFVSQHRAEIPYKSLHPKTRAIIREGAKAMLPPKVK